MAVYSKKDFENFLNKEKIKKQKIRNKILKITAIILSVSIFAGILLLIFSQKENYFKEDNITKAINFAIDQFATVEPVSHDDYPRLSLKFSDVYTMPELEEKDKNNKQDKEEKPTTDQPTDPPTEEETNSSHEVIFTGVNTSPTHPNQLLVNESIYSDTNNTDNKLIYTNNNLNNTYNDTLLNDFILTDNKKYNSIYNNSYYTSLTNTQETNNEEAEKEEPTQNTNNDPLNDIPTEYEYFLQIAGKGNYPGYDVSGKNYIKVIQKEVCLAIKAYTTMPLSSTSYKLKFTDDTYDYVYFFLIGEVKKVKRSYLSQLEDDASKNVLSLESFWVSLTEDRGSKTATEILTSGEKMFSVIVSDGDHSTIENAEVSLSSGSYYESYFVAKDSFVIFRKVPNGACKVNIRKSGYINFPHKIAYKELSDTYEVKENELYQGNYPTSAIKVNLRKTSEGKISFAFATYDYDINKKSMSVGKENISGHYNVDFYNKETKETNRYNIKFEDKESIYLCDIIDNLPTGKYNISVYPTNEKLDNIELKDLYINEYGISDSKYLTETKEYIFSFKSDNKVELKIDISDDSFGGLMNRKGTLSKYQLIETEIMKDNNPKLKLVNSKGEEVFSDLTEVDGRWVGSIIADKETVYDLYLSTIYGDIPLYEDLNTQRSDFNFKGSFKEELAGKCKAKLQVNTSGGKVTLTNAFDGEEFELKYDESVGGYVLKEDTILNSGYHFLKIYDQSGNINNAFLLMVSTSSNNYVLNIN